MAQTIPALDAVSPNIEAQAKHILFNQPTTSLAASPVA
jgi:hypothetical protein